MAATRLQGGVPRPGQFSPPPDSGPEKAELEWGLGTEGRPHSPTPQGSYRAGSQRGAPWNGQERPPAEGF